MHIPTIEEDWKDLNDYLIENQINKCVFHKIRKMR